MPFRPFLMIVPVALTSLLAGCNATVETLSFSMGAQTAWPVDPRSATVNGGTMPDVFSATGYGWENGAGAGTALTDWPEDTDKDVVTVTASWVELLTGQGWQASVDVNTSAFTPQGQARPAITLVALMGRNGELRVTQGTPTVLGTACGTRLPALDEDLRARADGDQRLSIPFDQAAGRPAPDTPCPAPGG